MANQFNTSRLDRYRSMVNPYKDAVLIQPIMVGGVVPAQVQERLNAEKWGAVGYSVCYDCLESRSSFVRKPPVQEFLQDVADFFGGEVAEHTLGCRAAQFAITKTIKEELDSAGSDRSPVLVADPLSHYTTAIAAEMGGLKMVQPKPAEPPEYAVDPESFIAKIEEVKASTGKLPSLIMVTHAESYNGNLNPAEAVGKIAEEYGIPYWVNAAYTGGILPVNMRTFHADFLTLSAHKSMASLGPLGYLVTRGDWSAKVFRGSEMQPSRSAKALPKKLTNLFGCSIGGIPLISSMYSFPYVVERVSKWDQELAKIRAFVTDLEKHGGIQLLGQRPHNHHLLHFDTPIIFKIAERHKRRGFFLAEEMIKQGIVGLHRGMSSHVKMSVYGLTSEATNYVRDSLLEIIDRYIREFQL